MNEPILNKPLEKFVPENSLTDKAEPTWWSNWGTFIIVGAVVLLIWAAYLIWLLSQNGYASKGQFGDAFGVINVLFSALAFAALFAALKLQTIELRFQRREFKNSVAAQRESANALVHQASLLLTTAEINAVVARIAACERDLDDAIGVNDKYWQDGSMDPGEKRKRITLINSHRVRLCSRLDDLLSSIASVRRGAAPLEDLGELR